MKRIADCLLQYYESDVIGETHGVNKYICADTHIDPEGEDLPLEHHQEVVERVIEICAMRDANVWHPQKIAECQEEHDIEIESLAKPLPLPSGSTGTQATCGSGNTAPAERDEMLGKALLCKNADSPPIAQTNDVFNQCVKDGYSTDKLFFVILEKPTEYKLFSE